MSKNTVRACKRCDWVGPESKTLVGKNQPKTTQTVKVDPICPDCNEGTERLFEFRVGAVFKDEFGLYRKINRVTKKNIWVTWYTKDKKKHASGKLSRPAFARDFLNFDMVEVTDEHID